MILGVDEAGRGPLAGPVIAAAVLLSDNCPFLHDLNDSKKLTHAKRTMLEQRILTDSLAFSIAIVDASIIDEINILNATLKAFEIAITKAISIKKPTKILIDGNKIPQLDFGIACESIVKGDSKIKSIMAASILAKCERDRIMTGQYHSLYPNYGFAKHKGYGTKEHMQNIFTFGPCPIHRKSFEPIKSLIVSDDAIRRV